MARPCHPWAVPPPLVVVDFDGTLTLSDVGDAICDRFADPSWRQLERRLAARELSMPEAQARMWPLVRAAPADVERFVHEAVTLRDGAAELLDAAAAGELELVLASGGFDLYIELVLARWIERGAFRARYANRARFAAGGIEVGFPHEALRCDYCAVCKGQVIRRHAPVAPGATGPDRAVVFAGDGESDLCAARLATHVFAIEGSRLATRCRQQGLAATETVSLAPVLAAARALLRG